MSAAVEQAPTGAAATTGVFVDVEVNINNPPGAAAPRASFANGARREPVVVVEDIESGPVQPPGDSSPAGAIGSLFAHGDALAVVLGLASVVS